MSILIGLALIIAIGTIAYVVGTIREIRQRREDRTGTHTPVAGQRLSAVMRRQHDMQRQIFEATADQVLWEASKNFARDMQREQHED